MKTTFVLGFFLLLMCCGSHAQPKEFYFSKLDNRDGLSNNLVQAIYKDSAGFMWIGTGSGVNRYDGYSFKVFRHVDGDSNSINRDDVSSIFAGPGGKIWMNTYTGINIYDPVTEKFDTHPERFFSANHLPYVPKAFFGGIVAVMPAKEAWFFVYADSGVYRWSPVTGTTLVIPQIGNRTPANPVVDSKMDSRGNLWLVHVDGLLEEFDRVSFTLLFRSTALQNLNEKRRSSYLLYIDRQDILWLHTDALLTGLYRFNPIGGDLQHYLKDSGAIRLTSNLVTDVCQDNTGLIWISTDQGGVNLLDTKKGKIEYLFSSDEAGSLAQNTITKLFRDDLGIIWLGSYKKGLSYYHPDIARFPLFHHRPGVPASLPYDDVDCFAEDTLGNLWIGTNGGGLLRFDRTSDKFTVLRHKSGEPNSPAGNVIVSLAFDFKGKLWIGYYQGGLDAYDGHQFIHHRHDVDDPASLIDDRVICIQEDSTGILWLGTMNGLDLFDQNKNVFIHAASKQSSLSHVTYISSLHRDSGSNMWIGTAGGIQEWTKQSGKFIHYNGKNNKLSNDIVNDIWKDRKGNTWAATRHGLNVMMPGQDTFRNFLVKDGLPDNNILNILGDDLGYLWVSTSSGLSKIAAVERAGNIEINCINYDENDGLQGNAFNRNAAFKTKSGELIFGGAAGFNLFKPASVGEQLQPPPIVITGVQLFHTDITTSFDLSTGLQLTHDENDLTFEFAALNYINAKKNKYTYKLEGYDKDWLNTDGTNRMASYSGLKPGKYIFRVKGSNGDRVWNEKGATLEINIKRPFWLTTLAFIVYFLLLSGVVYAACRLAIWRSKLRRSLDLQKAEAQRLHVLNSMKIKVLANVSQQFRAPLSMVLASHGSLAGQGTPPDSEKQFQDMDRNAKKLLQMISQVLDAKKLDAAEEQFVKTPGDIVLFVRDNVQSFVSLAGEDTIEFSFRSGIDSLVVLFDHAKIKQILFYLFSNVFKYTFPQGKMSLQLAITTFDEHKVWIELTITDSAADIALEDQADIVVTKEYVEMHGGKLTIHNTPNEGNCYTLLLPLDEVPSLPSDQASQLPRE